MAQTSANIFGKKKKKNIKEAKEYFNQGKAKPDLIIYAGEITGKPSTVIDFTGKEPIILRTGLVSKEELAQYINFDR